MDASSSGNDDAAIRRWPPGYGEDDFVVYNWRDRSFLGNRQRPRMMRIATMATAEDAAWLAAVTAGLAVTHDVAQATVLVASAARAEHAFACAGQRPVVLIGQPGGRQEQRASYVLRRGVPAEQVHALLSALSQRPVSPPQPDPGSLEASRAAQRAFVLSRRLAAATTLRESEALTVEVILELMNADRAQCLFHDSDAALWSQAQLVNGHDDRRAICGLAGFAARTHRPVAVERAGKDLRWVAIVDDPGGDGSERLLAQPVIHAQGGVHGVLVAVRLASRPAFDATEQASFAVLAALLAPFFDQLSLHAMDTASEPGEVSDGLFRSEALAAYSDPQRGQVVRLTPGWVSWAYWALAGLAGAAAAFVVIGRVSTVSTGAAIVRTSSKQELIARTSGNVAAVQIHPGDAVESGTVIARLDDQSQRAALDRVEQELATALRNHMLDPGDLVSDAAVRQLRQQRDAARAAVEERQVRSGSRGVVTDVRVRAGQRVEPGDIVASMVEGDGPLEVIGLLPGSDRPQLAAGMVMRLELSGYRYAYQSLTIDSVSADVIGPSEARRVLGLQVSESAALAGPVVLVRGRLPRNAFTVDGVTYRFHDGMQGSVTVRVRSERILFTILPGLRRL
jgi:biotin carboxyl carrier protein